MEGYVQAALWLAFLAWLVSGLFFSGCLAALGGKKLFVGTWVVWVGAPIVLFISLGIMSRVHEWTVAKQKRTFAELCSAPDREVIHRTVTAVDEVAIWPGLRQHALMRDWITDIRFFPLGPEWELAQKGGRSEAFRNTVVLNPDSMDTAAPRYHVIYDRIDIKGYVADDRMAGLRARIIDRSTGELIAERKDYVLGTKTGCNPDGSVRWIDEHLAFVHKVLNPVPRTVAVRHNITNEDAGRVEIPSILVAEIVAEEVRDWRFQGSMDPPQNARYTVVQLKETADTTLDEHTLTFRTSDGDVVVTQQLERGKDLLGLLEVEDGYVAMFSNFACGSASCLLVRRFGKHGALVQQERIGLPRGVEFSLCPESAFSLEQSNYRLRLCGKKKNVGGVVLDLIARREATAAQR